jgi:hypothetical protein
MYKITTTLVALLAIIPLFAHADDKCPNYVSGATIDWAIAVCEVRSETDDFESPAVQDCLRRIVIEDKIKNTSPENCKLNTRYKKEWCAHFVEYRKNSTMPECMESQSSIPKNVLNGGVGD